MHIGLIGGIGPSATDFYYRRLIDLAAQKTRDLSLTMVHADMATLLHNQANGQDLEQNDIYLGLEKRLRLAQADCMVITSIAGHFCIDGLLKRSTLPVVDITRVLSDWLARSGMQRVGILGTQAVMATGMYGKLTTVEVLAPDDDALRHVHDAYIELARTGQSSDRLRSIFVDAGERLMARGSEAILLGGTDLVAAFDFAPHPFPVVDCAEIHVQEIASLL